MNLIPVLGDLSGFIISAVLVASMAKNGASGKLLVRMSFNIILDATMGAIPLLGQIFDFYYKANTRNIRLLKEHYTEGKHKGSGKNLLIAIFTVLILLLVLVFYGIWKLAEYFFGLL